MKAQDLIKKSIDIEEIYRNIMEANNSGNFKIPIPHWRCVSDETKLKLIENGFKVYNGTWDGAINHCLIIEW